MGVIISGSRFLIVRLGRCCFWGEANSTCTSTCCWGMAAVEKLRVLLIGCCSDDRKGDKDAVAIGQIVPLLLLFAAHR